MERQEQAARHEWTRAVNEAHRAFGDALPEQSRDDRYAAAAALCREFVALGFVDPRDESVVWYALHNVAGAGEFRVEPEEVERVYNFAMEQLAIADLFPDEEPRPVQPQDWVVILWHSHYATQEPSEHDIAELSREVDGVSLAWIDYGLIFHALSGVTTAYNRGGIIQTTPRSLDTFPGVTHG